MPLASQLSNFFFAGSSASAGGSSSDEQVVGFAEPPRNAGLHTKEPSDRSSVIATDSRHTMKNEDVEAEGRPPYLHVRFTRAVFIADGGLDVVLTLSFA